jgi:hypothetical protein
MDRFTHQDLQLLMEERDGPCVSIFMPTLRAGKETQQNGIRFKNLLRQAEERLGDHGLHQQEARTLLKPAQELMDNSEFWEHQLDGLAVFVAKGFCEQFRLPLDLEEMVITGGQFHLKPVLPLLTGDGRFYLLALSQNKVRLFRGSRQSIRELELEQAPTSLAEALRYDDPEKHLQFRTSEPSKQASMFHGHGGGSLEEQEKDQILRFFHQVDAGIHEHLAGKESPLVLAGVEFLHPLYREANSYPHLIKEGIRGNPDEARAEELHEEAWEIVEPFFQKAREDAHTIYKELEGNDPNRVSAKIDEIVSAAVFGRVDTLFVARGACQWGVFDAEANEVHLHEETEPDNVDLLDFAATHTLSNSGTVFVTENGELPANAPVAAIFRY